MIYDYHIEVDVGCDKATDPSKIKKIVKKFIKKKFNGYSIEIKVDCNIVCEEDE